MIIFLVSLIFNYTGAAPAESEKSPLACSNVFNEIARISFDRDTMDGLLRSVHKISVNLEKVRRIEEYLNKKTFPDDVLKSQLLNLNKENLELTDSILKSSDPKNKGLLEATRFLDIEIQRVLKLFPPPELVSQTPSQSSTGESEEESEQESESSGGAQGGKQQASQGPSGKNKSQSQELSEQLQQLLNQQESENQNGNEKEGQENSQNSQSQSMSQSQSQASKDTGIEESLADKLKQLENKQKQKPNGVQESLKDGSKFSPGELNPFTQVELAKILKHLLEQAWLMTLKSYGNTELLMQKIFAYQDFSKKITDKYEFPFAKQYYERTLGLSKKLEMLQVNYSDLEVLANSMMTGSGVDISNHRKLIFLYEILSEIDAMGALSTNEERAFVALKHFLPKQKNPSDAESTETLGRAFLSQQIGPLSILELRRKYSMGNDQIDWQKLTDDLNSGELNKNIHMINTKPFLNFLLSKMFLPSFYNDFVGKKTAVSDSDRDVESADDLNRWKFFIMQSGNVKKELVRFLFGDMQEWTHREDVLVNDPVHPLPKIKTIILADISKSMDKLGKAEFKNALVASITDRIQKEIINGEAEHEIIYIAFDGDIRAPDFVRNPKEMMDFYSRIKDFPQDNGKGTNITQAIVRALELLAQEKVDRGNIFVITDGEDEKFSPELITEARNKIESKTEVTLSAITLIDGNDQLKQLIEQDGNQTINGLSYQNVSEEEIALALSPDKFLEILKSIASEFSSNMNQSFRLGEISLLRQQLISLKSSGGGNRALTARNQERQVQDILDIFSKGASSTQNVYANKLDVKPIIDIIKLLVVESDTQPWSRQDRALIMSEYIKSLKEVLNLEFESILGYLDPEFKTQIRTWLMSGST